MERQGPGQADRDLQDLSPVICFHPGPIRHGSREPDAGPGISLQDGRRDDPGPDSRHQWPAREHDVRQERQTAAAGWSLEVRHHDWRAIQG